MKQIASVQILRGLAALMVVFGHAQHHTLVQSIKLGGSFERVHFLPWGAGVDIFFVISGFIMVYASEDFFGREGASREFLARRVARIVPLYWMFTALYILFLMVGLAGATKEFSGWPNIVASFAFWPAYAAGHAAPMPVLELGWTLNYEMFFYVVFAVFLGLRRNQTVVAVAALLGSLVFAGFILQPSAAAPFFWTRPIVLEFVLGMGIALLLRHGVVLSGLMRAAILVGGVTILVADPINSSHQAIDWTTPNDAWRVIGWGLPAALIVCAAALGRQGQPSRLTKLGVHLGDASYVLYLSHPFVIVGIRKAMQWTGFEETTQAWPMLAVTVVSCCVFAVFAHRFVERPMTRFIQEILVRPRPPRTATA
ncbi:acyltransferase [Methylobacterium sp. W2]|uniref:acyltransferase family protein n=1 Tax=Methylobacterium sp. W2 TaxID=2598107 RepID=UPI001D0C9E7C|nr:acyltransferase [Methylobacterium sp. W2]MCC0804806.1 acyltransferase [Methylobacterium sp. W2]